MLEKHFSKSEQFGKNESCTLFSRGVRYGVSRGVEVEDGRSPPVGAATLEKAIRLLQEWPPARHRGI
jgi:hypothetical protein